MTARGADGMDTRPDAALRARGLERIEHRGSVPAHAVAVLAVVLFGAELRARLAGAPPQPEPAGSLPVPGDQSVSRSPGKRRRRAAGKEKR